MRAVGLTLLELLIVMALLATLMGIGIGVFRNLGSPDLQAAGQVRDALSVARNSAMRERAPATVNVDPATRTVFASGLRTVGNWHFEDVAGTGWPVDAAYGGGELVDAGVIGSALELDDDEVLVLSELPSSFDSPHGFGVDLYVAPQRDPRPMTLIERPGSWAVALDREDRLVVTLQLEGAGAEPEEFAVAVPAPMLTTGRFVRVTVTFDGRLLHLALDGARATEDTRFDVARPLAVVSSAVVRTGEGPTRLRGQLDELRLLSVVVGQPDPLPVDVDILGAAQLIHVDAFGRLDRSHHAAPVEIAFQTGDPPRRTSVEMGLLGTVRTLSGPAAGTGGAP